MAVTKIGAWLRKTNDAWENVATGLGNSLRDKRLAAVVTEPPANMQEDAYEALYAGDDVAARIAEVPPREMTRQGFEVTIATEDEDQEGRTENVEKTTSAAKELMGFLEEKRVPPGIFESLVWARVHGGALLQMVVDDGLETSEPLDESAIKSFLGVKVWTRWQARPDSFYDDPDDILKYGKPEKYRIYNSGHPRQAAAGFDAVIHETRVLRFDGVMTTPRRRNRQEGWSDSIYARMASIIRDYSTSYEGIAHVMQDWGQFVYHMKDLSVNLASEGGDKLILDRIGIIDYTRSLVRAILLDADNESAERLGMSATGVPELADRMARRLAQAAEMPLTLLLGQSPDGMNATGESDIRLFYDQMSARQENELRPQIERLVKIVFLSADGPTSGAEPENWNLTFCPLWQMTEQEKAQTRKTQAETDNIYIQNGVLLEDEVAQSRFGGDRYSTETQLDAAAREERAEFEEEMRQNLINNPPPPPPATPGATPQPQPPQRDEPATDREDTIEKRKGKYVVLSKSGKILGEHDTRKEAERQLRAVEAAKAKS